MKFKKKKIAAIALSAMLMGSALAGCDLVTTDSQKDLLQVVAEVNITSGAAFRSGGEYEQYASAITTSDILKRDLVASYMSVGYQYVESYGYTYEKAFDLIIDSLINRQIYLQYAKAYFFDTQSTTYTMTGYTAAVSAAEGDDLDKQLAGLSYFLDETEIAVANYTVRKSFNTSIDSQEENIITASEDSKTYDTARTTPTGVDTEVEDYYDAAYKIYIGSNSASDCGSYETVDGSTPTTRRKAYGQFLASLSTYALVTDGENTSSPESLSYYKLELKNAYEDAVIDKLTEAFESEAEKNVTKEWIEEQYASTLASQKGTFDSSTSDFESALDSVSDSSFVLYSPDAKYGFVINILLPFSSTQSATLEAAPADYGDKHGNTFQTRAKLLQSLKATDQRKTWFTCEEDYSYTAEVSDDVYTGGDSSRTYLFFENNLKKTEQYEPIANYLGAYTYNGTVSKNEDGVYTVKPNQVTIDGFLSEMKGYLGYAGYSVVNETSYNDASDSYYNKSVADYYGDDGNVDYSRFVYYYGQVAKDGATIASTFNADNVFVAESTENKAMSVMNELSFAYNTDTAGLNSYLGYVVSPDETDYVKEFEYAAQLAVQGGAGTIVVAPSEYGWHIMYCTFSYAATEPYTFSWDEIDVEGSFSNLYYEAKKASNLSDWSTDRRTTIINDYYTDSCVTTYADRYADLIEAGDSSSSD